MPQESEQELKLPGRLRKKLKHAYRLVLMNNETFEEIGSYRLSLWNVYIALSILVVLGLVALFLAVRFTPLNKYITGYDNAGYETELKELVQQVDTLEKELEKYQTFALGIRNRLSGGEESTAQMPEIIGAGRDSSFEKAERSEVDEQLRREVEFEKTGKAAQQPRTANFFPRDIPLEQMYFSPPLSGNISAGFMPGRNHFGVDVLAPKNTAVKAAMDGYIFFSDWTLETGNTIGIQHTNNLITFYKHNSVLLKKAGSFVKAGEAVAIIGNTGTLSDGPHLHFELWHKGKPLDPPDYINF